MDNNHLKDGKIIFPNKLKINKKFNVGLIGTGKIAQEYIKVINSFNHNLAYVCSISKNKNAAILAKKNKAKIIYNLKETILKKDVDFWVVCSHWNKLRYIFLNISEIKKPVLFEKSLIINSGELKKIKKVKKFSLLKNNISFAFNRNYYDYIYYLASILSNDKVNYGCSYLHDPYKKLIRKKQIPKKYLVKYITSHWVSLILKIFHLSKIKIVNKKIEIIDKKKDFKKICLLLKSKNNRFNFDIYNFPDLPKNHQINFFLKDKIIEISPIEKIKIYNNLQKKVIHNQNIYYPKVKEFKVDKKFKPGFRHQYYDFINQNFFKKKTLLSTNFDGLEELYKILEIMN